MQPLDVRVSLHAKGFKANCNYVVDSVNQEDRESVVLALFIIQA